MNIGIVIPIYNHPQVLPQLVARLLQEQLPIILVDDGCEASCKAVIDDLAHQHPHTITVVRHAVNQGKGQAVMSGLLRAQEMGWSHALQLDADGQHHWADIGRFVYRAHQNPQHMIIGTPVYDDTVSKGRYYGRYLTHIWVWINTLSTDIHDSMCGFRVYPVAPCCELIHHTQMAKRMGFDSEILVRLHWQGVPFINLPTPVTYPADGVSHFQPWQDNWCLSKMHARLFFGMLKRLPTRLKQRYGRNHP